MSFDCDSILNVARKEYEITKSTQCFRLLSLILINFRNLTCVTWLNLTKLDFKS